MANEAQRMYNYIRTAPLEARSHASGEVMQGHVAFGSVLFQALELEPLSQLGKGALKA